MHPAHLVSSIAPRTPFQGWCWRGADLAPREMAAYVPGAVLRHLGPAAARTGAPRDFPMIFWIHAWERCARIGDTGTVVFEPDAAFRVVRVDVMTDNRLCCFLEQDAAGGGDLEAAYEARLLETLPRPAPPDPELIEAFAGPFARWSMDAVPGDPPLLGQVYEAEEAVRFASAWSGVDAEVVRRVLEAKARYLMLAGLGGCEEDDGLIREREAVRHLLPETPGVVDDRETDYVVLATDLDEETVLRVTQGETAYLEGLGLLTWEGDADREAALGVPVLDGDPGGREGDAWEDSPLREGQEHPWGGFRLAYQVAPSFAPAYGLTVDHDQGQTHLRFHLAADPGARKPALRPPSMLLPPEEVHLLVSGLRRLRIAPFAPSKDGLDGVTYSLRIQHGVDTAEFCWWCDLPKGWGGLRRIQERLEAYCATYFHFPPERSFR